MRLTDRLNIATDVYPGCKTTKQISQLLVSASKSHSYHQCQLISQLLDTANIEQWVTVGLPLSGKNIWNTKFFPGQGKVREFC